VQFGHPDGNREAKVDLRIVAEGVETVAQQEFLTDMGCHSLQGFLFGHPMPPAQFLAALEHHKAQQRHTGAEGLRPSSATE
jgi:sensor c-di-GMP phosphodiesterase-like protein